jgi:hypothetical protein
MAKSKAKEKSKPDGPRPRNDAYVMMLVITFVSILAGCIFLHFDYAGTKDLGLGEDPGYGSRVPTKETIPTIPSLGEAGAPAGGGAKL